MAKIGLQKDRQLLCGGSLQGFEKHGGKHHVEELVLIHEQSANRRKIKVVPALHTDIEDIVAIWKNIACASMKSGYLLAEANPGGNATTQAVNDMLSDEQGHFLVIKYLYTRISSWSDDCEKFLLVSALSASLGIIWYEKFIQKQPRKTTLERRLSNSGL